MGAELRQLAVLRGIVERAAAVEAIQGVIAIGSFARGNPDELSDLDLIAVAAAGRLEEAWAARELVAGDVVVMWEPAPETDREAKEVNWLTRDLVKVEWCVAAAGSRDLCEPFEVVSGAASIASLLPRVDAELVAERRRARMEEQRRDFDPSRLTPEERIAWSLWELKRAVRAVTSRTSD